MEYQKITNLLGNISDKVPRIFTKTWIEVHDQSGETYNTKKQIRFKTSMLRSDLFDYSDAYIGFTGKSTVTNQNKTVFHKKLTPKNTVPFLSCISKINHTLIDNAKDLDIVMPCTIYLNTAKIIEKQLSLSNYYKDEPNSGAVGNINYSIKDSKSFNYKTSITRKLEGNNIEKDVEIVMPLKYLSNFGKH